MILTESGLKMPEAEDFYNIQDFNDNFSITEDRLENIEKSISEINSKLIGFERNVNNILVNNTTLSNKIDSVESELKQKISDSTVTGIITSVSQFTVNLGFQPRAVMVFATHFNAGSAVSFSHLIALAVRGSPQMLNYNDSYSPSLEITSSGFKVERMCGDHVGIIPNASTYSPLRYIAFR